MSKRSVSQFVAANRWDRVPESTVQKLLDAVNFGGCLSLSQLQIGRLDRSLWTQDQQFHVEQCGDCQRILRQLERQEIFAPTAQEMTALSNELIDAFALGPEALFKIASNPEKPLWIRLEAIDSIDEFRTTEGIFSEAAMTAGHLLQSLTHDAKPEIATTAQRMLEQI